MAYKLMAHLSAARLLRKFETQRPVANVHVLKESAETDRPEIPSDMFQHAKQEIIGPWWL